VTDKTTETHDMSATKLNLEMGFAFGELDKLMTQAGDHYGPAMGTLFVLLKEAGRRAFVLERMASAAKPTFDFDMTVENIRAREAAKLLLSMGYRWDGAWMPPRPTP
jgi:hypothetical protein